MKANTTKHLLNDLPQHKRRTTPLRARSLSPDYPSNSTTNTLVKKLVESSGSNCSKILNLSSKHLSFKHVWTAKVTENTFCVLELNISTLKKNNNKDVKISVSCSVNSTPQFCTIATSQHPFGFKEITKWNLQQEKDNLINTQYTTIEAAKCSRFLRLEFKGYYGDSQIFKIHALEVCFAQEQNGHNDAIYPTNPNSKFPFPVVSDINSAPFLRRFSPQKEVVVKFPSSESSPSFSPSHPPGEDQKNSSQGSSTQQTPSMYIPLDRATLISALLEIKLKNPHVHLFKNPEHNDIQDPAELQKVLAVALQILTLQQIVNTPYREKIGTRSSKSLAKNTASSGDDPSVYSPSKKLFSPYRKPHEPEDGFIKVSNYLVKPITKEISPKKTPKSILKHSPRKQSLIEGTTMKPSLQQRVHLKLSPMVKDDAPAPYVWSTTDSAISPTPKYPALVAESPAKTPASQAVMKTPIANSTQDFPKPLIFSWDPADKPVSENGISDDDRDYASLRSVSVDIEAILLEESSSAQFEEEDLEVASQTSSQAARIASPNDWDNNGPYTIKNKLLLEQENLIRQLEHLRNQATPVHVKTPEHSTPAPELEDQETYQTFYVDTIESQIEDEEIEIEVEEIPNTPHAARKMEVDETEELEVIEDDNNSDHSSDVIVAEMEEQANLPVDSQSSSAQDSKSARSMSEVHSPENKDPVSSLKSATKIDEPSTPSSLNHEGVQEDEKSPTNANSDSSFICVPLDQMKEPSMIEHSSDSNSTTDLPKPLPQEALNEESNIIVEIGVQVNPRTPETKSRRSDSVDIIIPLRRQDPLVFNVCPKLQSSSQNTDTTEATTTSKTAPPAPSKTATSAYNDEVVRQASIQTPKFLNFMKLGTVFQKHHYHSKQGKMQKRTIKLDPSLKYLVIQKPGATLIMAKPKKIPLEDIQWMVYGPHTKVWKNKNTIKPWRCFSIVCKKRSLDLEAPTDMDVQIWILGLQSLVYHTIMQHNRPLYTRTALLFKKVYMKLISQTNSNNLHQVIRTYVMNNKATQFLDDDASSDSLSSYSDY